ncbi:MAG: helix-turn-helix domain-containing protein [Eubacterium sp.]|nr:helix-turn-helix domain-containing protein [Eubacterium sp.]
MTFGEKLREARKAAGLSQEQFAEKMSVSRSAVAKWESDKGLPDVNNLKVMAQLLGVTIDYLLDDEEKLNLSETKEPIDLESFEKTGKARDKKDAAVLAKFPNADAVYPLIRQKKMSKKEDLLDFIVLPGVVQMLDYMNNSDGYYLVEQGGRQYLVRVSKDFITTTELAQHVDTKKFTIDNNVFKRAVYQLI